MLVSETVIKATPNQVSSDISQESVILNLENGTYYSLNEVGTRIWHLIQEPISIEAVTALLQEEYEVSLDECRQGILALLDDLNQQGLIEVQRESVA